MARRNRNRTDAFGFGTLPCGEAVLRSGICAYAQSNRGLPFSFGAVADGKGIAAAGAGALANGNVVGGGNGGRAVVCAVGVCAQRDVVLGLNAFCRARTNPNNVIHRNGIAHIADCAFADADIAVVIGVPCIHACLFADKHIGTTRRVGIPAQRGGVQSCGF